jgi:hypothetical protein
MMNLRRNFAFGCWALAVLAFASGSVAQAQTSLAYKFKQGDKANYVMEQKMLMKMNIMGQALNMNMDMKMNMTQTVHEVGADGKAKISQKLDTISCSMGGLPGLNFMYDSVTNKNPADPIGQKIAPLFNAMAGAEVKMTISPTGDITDTQIPQDVLNAMKQAAAGGGPGLGDMFSKENMSKMFAQNINLPAQPVKVGDTWQSKSTAKTPGGDVETTQTYKYEGTAQHGGKNVEKISFTLDTRMLPGGNPNPGVMVKIKSQTGKGTIFFDNQAGQVVETTMTQNSDMETTVLGMTIPQTVDTTVTVKLQDRK